FLIKRFSITPKPLKLINRLIELSTNEGDIILDFFAGSGTTAHGVLELSGCAATNGQTGGGVHLEANSKIRV
ncbi:DNA methyltransferase, partial [Helicobacter pylori]|uniref:DNA methyltransferase n=1 Tax=Helicobacter pylori TaxID=210 RepID=UPI0020B6D897